MRLWSCLREAPPKRCAVGSESSGYDAASVAGAARAPPPGPRPLDERVEPGVTGRRGRQNAARGHRDAAKGDDQDADVGGQRPDLVRPDEPDEEAAQCEWHDARPEPERDAGSDDPERKDEQGRSQDDDMGRARQAPRIEV